MEDVPAKIIDYTRSPYFEKVVAAELDANPVSSLQCMSNDQLLKCIPSYELFSEMLCCPASLREITVRS